jgi:hypothetical protein
VRLDETGEGRARSTISTALARDEPFTAGDSGPLVVVIPGVNLDAATTIGLIDTLAADQAPLDPDDVDPGRPRLPCPGWPSR